MLPTLVSAWVMSTIDRVFIERYFDIHDVGIYSLGYKIAMLVTIVSGAFYKAYNPFYFKMATTGVREEVLPQLKKTNTVYVLLVIVTSSMIALFSKEIVYLFFDPLYLKTYKIISIVSLAFAITSFSGIFNLAIYQEKKTMFLLYANITAAFVNIGLNFLLISNYGVYGAAWATVITYLVVALLSFYYAKKCFYATFNSKIVTASFITLMLINMIFYYLDLEFRMAFIMKSLIIFSILLLIWFKFKTVIVTIIKKK
jgi:O-antigen/teichoic acid export membrane protein